MEQSKSKNWRMYVSWSKDVEPRIWQLFNLLDSIWQFVTDTTKTKIWGGGVGRILASRGTTVPIAVGLQRKLQKEAS